MNWFHRPPLRGRWLWLAVAAVVAATFVDGGGVL